ncbi:MAG TPA: helix-turn-helix domain-containing protein [Nitrososphaeraceae archaeon]|nr:helix-turn-helix domain-containing protein [Nitrososphaeraceae archaeon]
MSRPSNSINMLTQVDSSCEDIFACLYNLSTSEINLLTILLKSKKPLTLEELSNKISRDKGTVFRSLQKLVSLDLCTKESKTLKGGGYYHLYSAVDIDTIEKNIELRIREIQRSLNRIVKKFRNDIEKKIKN